MFETVCPSCGHTIRGNVLPLRCGCGSLAGQLAPLDPATPAEVIPPRRPPMLLPIWQADRIQSCACCLTRRRIRCGDLADRGKGADLMAGRGIPNPDARCPLGRWSNL